MVSFFFFTPSAAPRASGITDVLCMFVTPDDLGKLALASGLGGWGGVLLLPPTADLYRQEQRARRFPPGSLKMKFNYKTQTFDKITIQSIIPHY